MGRIITTQSGKRLQVGGLRRPASRCKLHFHDYISMRALPTPPPITNYAVAAAPALAQMDDNATLGCCVIAANYHLLGSRTGNAGTSAFVATDDQIVKDYSAIGGYVPGVPNSDEGCDPVVACDYYVRVGYANGDKLLGYVSVDAANPELVRVASWLSVGCMIAVELPDAWTANEPDTSGFVWDVAGDPNPNDGHAVALIDYSDKGVVISTWGMTGLMTWQALAKYAVPSANGGLYALFSQDSINAAKGLAPAGVNLAQLEADFRMLGGTLP